MKAGKMLCVGSLYMSRVVPKWCLRWTSELDCFSKNLRSNWTKSCKQSLWDCVDIGDEECVVPLDLFLLVGNHTYKRPFTSTSSVLVELVEAHIERTACAVGVGKRQQKRCFRGR